MVDVPAHCIIGDPIALGLDPALGPEGGGEIGCDDCAPSQSRATSTGQGQRVAGGGVLGIDCNGRALNATRKHILF